MPLKIAIQTTTFSGLKDIADEMKELYRQCHPDIEVLEINWEGLNIREGRIPEIKVVWRLKPEHLLRK